MQTAHLWVNLDNRMQTKICLAQFFFFFLVFNEVHLFFSIFFQLLKTSVTYFCFFVNAIAFFTIFSIRLLENFSKKLIQIFATFCEKAKPKIYVPTSYPLLKMTGSRDRIQIFWQKLVVLGLTKNLYRFLDF